MGENCRKQGNTSLPNRASRVVCSSLELMYVLPPTRCLDAWLHWLWEGRGCLRFNCCFSRLGLLDKPPWSILLLEAMLMSVASEPLAMSMIHAGGHADVRGLMLVFVVCSIAWDHVDICFQIYQQRTHGCLCLWEAMLRSIFCVTTGGHVEVHGLCCHLEPCWCLWSMLAVSRNHTGVHDLCFSCC